MVLSETTWQMNHNLWPRERGQGAIWMISCFNLVLKMDMFRERKCINYLFGDEEIERDDLLRL